MRNSTATCGRFQEAAAPRPGKLSRNFPGIGDPGAETVLLFYLAMALDFERPASVMPSGFRRRGEELFGDLAVDSPFRQLHPRLPCAGPGTAAAPATWSGVQTVKTAVRRMSAHRQLQLQSGGLIGLPTGTVYHGTMSKIHPEFLDADLPGRAEAADFFLRQEPDEEEEEEEDEDDEDEADGEEDDDDDHEEGDEGYSE
jgi:hypothetical protein